MDIVLRPAVNLVGECRPFGNDGNACFQLEDAGFLRQRQCFAAGKAQIFSVVTAQAFASRRRRKL